MAAYNAAIKKALLAQETLINNGEHCAGDPEKLAMIGRMVGHQIRVMRTTNEVALYTLSNRKPPVRSMGSALPMPSYPSTSASFSSKQQHQWPRLLFIRTSDSSSGGNKINRQRDRHWRIE